MIKTELELRFIIDISRPLSPGERTAMLTAIGSVRHLRQLGGRLTDDLDDMERTVSALPEGTPAKSLDDARRDALHTALTEARGNVLEAARRLGVSRHSVHTWAHDYGFKLDAYRALRYVGPNGHHAASLSAEGRGADPC